MRSFLLSKLVDNRSIAVNVEPREDVDGNVSDLVSHC